MHLIAKKVKAENAIAETTINSGGIPGRTHAVAMNPEKIAAAW